MNKIKISALVMSALFTFGSIASAADFTDMPTDEVTALAIENAVKNGLLSGYEDNTVRPDANIRRSEMAVIITKACKVEKEGNLANFIDVSKEDWFYSAMAKAYEMGAFSGSGDRMNPNDNITFQECFTVLSQVFDLIPPYTRPAKKDIPDPLPENNVVSGSRLYDISVLDSFADKDEVADWAKVFYAGIIVNGGWNGIDNMLTPKAYITRAQFATVMDNLIQNYIDEPTELTELPEGNTMIRCDDVVLKGIEADGDIYIGDSVSANGITVEDVNIKGRLVVRGCATPVKDENGELTYGETGITLTGHIDSVRVIRPYINLNMVGTTTKTPTYATHDTNLAIGLTLE